MSDRVEIQSNGSALHVAIRHPRMDGENYILKALRDGQYFKSDVRALTIDMEPVEYLNSIGVTEIINIYRQFTEAGVESFDFQLHNVDNRVYAILDLIGIDQMARVQVKET